jgi:hypothetical protein
MRCGTGLAAAEEARQVGCGSRRERGEEEKNSDAE